MTENEKIIEDFQKPWDEKLAEAKAKSGIVDDEEIIEEKKVETPDHQP